MLIHHAHPPGVFEAGHCRARAREAGLLDHYHRVQREEASLAGGLGMEASGLPLLSVPLHRPGPVTDLEAP